MAEEQYPEGVTSMDHIKHDIRMGRFPNQSSVETFLAERAAASGASTNAMPYTLQADEGGTFLQSEAGQLFICADIGTVRRCLRAIGTPSDPA